MATPSTASSSAPDEDFVAALIAVQAFLAEEQGGVQAATSNTNTDRWRESAKLVVQDLQPRRIAVPPRWSTIERLRRSTGGGYGVTGL